MWRLRPWANADLRFFLAGLPALGVLSLPLSWLMLETARSTMAPQWQPLRTVLFLTAMASLTSLAAGLRAAQSARWPEAIAWLAAAAILPTANAVQDILWPNLADFLIVRRLLLVLYVAAGLALTAWSHAAGHRWRTKAWLAALVLPFFLYPVVGGVRNYQTAGSAELDALCRWARSSTAKDAVFLFPDAGRELYPGVFRAQALRAVYRMKVPRPGQLPARCRRRVVETLAGDPAGPIPPPRPSRLGRLRRRLRRPARRPPGRRPSAGFRKRRVLCLSRALSAAQPIRMSTAIAQLDGGSFTQ